MNVYTDSDWAGQHQTCKSTGGGVTQWGSTALSAWSRTQQSVSLSFAEAEVHTLTTRISEGMMTKDLLKELGYDVTLVNHVDSQSAKAWASKRGLGRMKHVMLKYMFVQDVVEKKQTTLAYVNRCFAQVDPFVLNFSERSAVDAMYGVDGAAARRRDRRLRQFLRHEQLSVKMHVAAALHHSAQRGARVDASTQTDSYAAATCAATAASVPIFEYVAPAPVIEYISPAPAMTYVEFSQQLPPVDTTSTVATDVNLDVTGFVSPQISSTAVEPSSPHVVDSLPPLEEFTELVYNQADQEQFVAGEMTQNITGNSSVQEQVIVHNIPPIVEQIQEQIVETIDVTPQGSQMALNTSSTSTSSSSTSTGTGCRLDEFARMLDSCIELLTPVTAQIDSIEKETEKAAMVAKRMMETPLPEPPLPEPPMVEPSSTTSSAKRRRWTRFSPLPRIMEHAVYLAPSAWPPIRHA